MKSLGFSIYSIISSAYNDNFISSFPIWTPFLSLSSFLSYFLTFFQGFPPTAYGSSQSRGWLEAVATSLCHSHKITVKWASSSTYTSAHGNTKSLTHWVRLGTEPESLWVLVRFVSTERKRELWYLLFPFLVWLLWLGLPILCWIEGESGHPCSVPDLSGKTFSFSEYCIECSRHGSAEMNLSRILEDTGSIPGLA